MEYKLNMHVAHMEYTMWNMHGTCVEYTWNMNGVCIEHAWNMYGECIEYARNMHGTFFVCAWSSSWKMHGA